MLEFASRRLGLIMQRFSSTHRFKSHARSPFPVASGRVDPPEGCGVIRFTSKAVARAARPRPERSKSGTPLPPKGNEYRVLRPGHFAPVVLVDGIPAAAGLGKGRIVVPAGRHLVQVQAQASGRYWPVEVEEGREVKLASVVSEPYFSGALQERMRRFYRCFSLGPRAFLLPQSSLFGPIAVAVATVALLSLVLGPGDPRGPAAAVIAGVLLASAPWARWSWHRLRGVPSARFEPVGADVTWRPVDPVDPSEPVPGSDAILRINVVFLHDYSREHRPVDLSRTPMPQAPVAARPIPGRKRDPDAPVIEVLGEELEGMGRWAQTEWRTLARNMGWDRERRTRLSEARKRYAAGADNVPWIEPPRVTLDDRELPAVWGLNEYRLPPGEYDLLEIAIPPPAPLLDKGNEVELTGSSRLLFELDLREGSVTEIEGFARIESTMNADGLTLTRYAGRIWTAEPPRNST